MKMNILRMAFLALAISLFMPYAGVNAEDINIDQYCKYIDQNEVRYDNGLLKLQQFVHIKEANDVADIYNAILDPNGSPQIVSSSCVKVSFHGKENVASNYVRYPLMPGPEDKDHYIMSMPANSYVYIPYEISSPVGKSDLTSLLMDSALNVVGMDADKGVVITKNANGGISFILREVYSGAWFPTSSLPNALSGSDAMCPNGEKFYRNCAVRYGPLKDGQYHNIGRPFFSTFKVNFVLWIMVIFTLGYFIWALGSSTNDPMLPHYIGSTWFNWSFYSVWTFGNPRQTKTSRLTLILINMGGHLIACAFMHWIFRNKDIVQRVAIASAVGLGFGWICQRIGGCFLHGLTMAHHKFLDEVKSCTTHDQREDCLDRYDNARLTWNYLFYVYALLVWMGACWGSIGILINFDNTRFWWFMLSFGICLVIEFIIIDAICMMLGKGDGGFAHFIQSRGYYIDFPLHDKFDKYLSELD